MNKRQCITHITDPNGPLLDPYPHRIFTGQTDDIAMLRALRYYVYHSLGWDSGLTNTETESFADSVNSMVVSGMLKPMGGKEQ